MSIGPEGIRELARKRLPHFLFEYVDGGSYAETTLRRNESSLAEVRLTQRVLRDVSGIDPTCSLLGRDWPVPLALGPVGLAGMLARRGEVQAAHAASKAGIPFCLSTVSVCDIAEVAPAAGSDFWFQLYMIRDRAFMKDLLAIAREHCHALVLTVDMPVGATRYRDYRSGLSGRQGIATHARRALQAAMRPSWAWNVGLLGKPHSLGNLVPVLGGKAGTGDFAGWIARNFDPAVTWRDLAFVRDHWSGPLLIKGIMDADDADAAVGLQADGIIVSNHGGRQLDGVSASCEMLPKIADRVRGRTKIMIDGGVRSGLDLFKMLALGADAVLLGRAWAYALAAGGGREVAALIARMAAELEAAMAMTGCRTLADIDGRVLEKRI